MRKRNNNAVRDGEIPEITDEEFSKMKPLGEVFPVDRISKKQKQSRSRLVGETVGDLSKKEKDRELIEGYKVMGREDSKLAEENFLAGAEKLDE